MNSVHVVMIVASGMASPSISRWRPALLDVGGRHLGSWGAPETKPGLRLFGQDKGWFLGHKNYIKPTIHTHVSCIYTVKKYFNINIYIYICIYTSKIKSYPLVSKNFQWTSWLFNCAYFILDVLYIYIYIDIHFMDGYMDTWTDDLWGMAGCMDGWKLHSAAWIWYHRWINNG